MTPRNDLHTLPADLPVPTDDGGAAHLVGRELPALALPSTAGRTVRLDRLGAGWSVLYCYPRTGGPDEPGPPGWDAIPGARGCTPQACGYRDHHAELRGLGAQVFGVSTQTTEYQREMATRLGLPFDVLSDADFRLTDALGLPTFEAGGMRLMKRLTLLARGGRIEACFYPVFPPDADAERVLAWLRERGTPSSSCVFCGIARGELDAVRLHDDDDVAAFLDSHPVRPGHTLIIPKAHVATFDELPAALGARILAVGQTLAQRMKAAFRVERVAFLFSGGDVAHVHAHVFPMHEKTDLTSGRYVVGPAEVRWSSEHLRADRASLERVRGELTDAAGGGERAAAGGGAHVVSIDHVQLAMPAGGEAAARAFYAGVLGLEEEPKPAALAGRGGAWFRRGAVQLHLGVEAEFRPARKAHPALRVEGLAALVARCEAAGHAVTRDVPLAGIERVHVADPFGNRIELLEMEKA
jgi:peroxiredoxin/diadenosine tetraphosphate (Ap4A) HIT family hydrolase/catechol 2,3-dioxygenase-like lactoylglutathione lyase family enzyme